MLPALSSTTLPLLKPTPLYTHTPIRSAIRRGRTLWFIGDSQTCHFFFAAECFLREFAPTLKRRPAFPKDINMQLNTHDPVRNTSGFTSSCFPGCLPPPDSPSTHCYQQCCRRPQPPLPEPDCRTTTHCPRHPPAAHLPSLPKPGARHACVPAAGGRGPYAGAARAAADGAEEPTLCRRHRALQFWVRLVLSFLYFVGGGGWVM